MGLDTDIFEVVSAQLSDQRVASYTMNVSMKTKDRKNTLSELHIMHISPGVRLQQHHASYGVHSLFLLLPRCWQVTIA